MWRQKGKNILREIADAIAKDYRKHLKEKLDIEEKLGPETAKEYWAKRHDVLVDDLKNHLEIAFRIFPGAYIGTFMSYQSDLVVECHDKRFSLYFGCERIWVELELENPVTEEKLDALKDMLSHKWLILIIKTSGEFEIHRPHAWHDFR